ncbi:hypothetical protein WJX72_003525 [[Myrmecia] bisecta]|uniref:Uncharacterized protein n=1 Tax=[Myrmecia] bisecta TaxID=41462 RepID=A0AAW1PKL3_9CHLO
MSREQQSSSDEPAQVDAELAAFWEQLDLPARRALLQVDRQALFKTIRAQYCSRCFGLFVMRYGELASLHCSGEGAALDCPACAEFYAGLVVLESGAVALSDELLRTQPFAAFEEARLRERERELQFMTGNICGSGWQKKSHQTMCNLHTSPVPYEALTEYWASLPPEHRSTLFSMRDEDFVSELDAHMKYHLKICKDCRCNVMRAFKELKPLRSDPGHNKDVKGDLREGLSLEVCEGHRLTIMDGLVCVDGEAAGAAAFFERAEEVEECKAVDPDMDDDYNNPDRVRHAETPELAREALIDSVVLIFKSQVEVAFREQTAGHNALLLFVHLALRLMEERLVCAFKELRVKQAEAELLELVAEDKKKAETKKSKKKKAKAKASVAKKEEEGLRQTQCNGADSSDSLCKSAGSQCSSCAALQQGAAGSSSSRSSSPVRPNGQQHTAGSCAHSSDTSSSSGTGSRAHKPQGRSDLDVLPPPARCKGQKGTKDTDSGLHKHASGASAPAAVGAAPPRGSTKQPVAASVRSDATHPAVPVPASHALVHQASSASQLADEKDGWEVQQRGRRNSLGKRSTSSSSLSTPDQTRASSPEGAHSPGTGSGTGPAPSSSVPAPISIPASSSAAAWPSLRKAAADPRSRVAPIPLQPKNRLPAPTETAWHSPEARAKLRMGATSAEPNDGPMLGVRAADVIAGLVKQPPPPPPQARSLLSASLRASPSAGASPLAPQRILHAQQVPAARVSPLAPPVAAPAAASLAPSSFVIGPRVVRQTWDAQAQAQSLAFKVAAVHNSSASAPASSVPADHDRFSLFSHFPVSNTSFPSMQQGLASHDMRVDSSNSLGLHRQLPQQFGQLSMQLPQHFEQHSHPAQQQKAADSQAYQLFGAGAAAGAYPLAPLLPSF